MSDILQTGNGGRRDQQTRDILQSWLSPFLIAIVSYFAKSKLEEIGSKLDILSSTIPVLQHRVLILEQQMIKMRDDFEDHRTDEKPEERSRNYYLKPEDRKRSS